MNELILIRQSILLKLFSLRVVDHGVSGSITIHRTDPVGGQVCNFIHSTKFGTEWVTGHSMFSLMSHTGGMAIGLPWNLAPLQSSPTDADCFIRTHYATRVWWCFLPMLYWIWFLNELLAATTSSKSASMNGRRTLACQTSPWLFAALTTTLGSYFHWELLIKPFLILEYAIAISELIMLVFFLFIRNNKNASNQRFRAAVLNENKKRGKGSDIPKVSR